MESSCTRFITSFLSVNEELSRVNALVVKHNFVTRGKIVQPLLAIESDRQLNYITETVEKFLVIKHDKDNRMPSDAAPVSKRGGFEWI